MARDNGTGCIGQLLLIPILFIIGYFVDMCNNSESSMIKDARNSGMVGKYCSYLEKHPKGEYVEEALDSIYSITIRMKNPHQHIEGIFAIANDVGVKGSRIEKPLKDFIYSAVEKENSEYYWNKFLELADEEYIKDAKSKKEELENAMWGTESIAWQTVIKSKDTNSYKKYMDLYPNGKHYSEAKKNYVQMSVSAAAQGNYYELPPMQKNSGSGKRNTIHISNQTSYELNIFYSGPEYETASIAPHSSGSLNLPIGIYNISARVNANNVRPYYGTQTLSGGDYSVSYYISNH